VDVAAEVLKAGPMNVTELAVAMLEAGYVTTASRSGCGLRWGWCWRRMADLRLRSGSGGDGGVVMPIEIALVRAY